MSACFSDENDSECGGWLREFNVECLMQVREHQPCLRCDVTRV